MDLAIKTCTRCFLEKPITDFNKHPSTSDGYLHQCKTCRAIYAKQYYQAHSELVKAKNKKWSSTQRGKDVIKAGRLNNYKKAMAEKGISPKAEYSRKWRAANLDKARESARIWANKNSEKCAESLKKWRADNPDKRKKIGRDGYHRNKVKHLEDARKWKSENKEKIAVYDRLRLLQFPLRVIAIRRLNYAIRRKAIEKQPCWICAEVNVEGHHPDYNYPLDVVWLCKIHHSQIHNVEV